MGKRNEGGNMKIINCEKVREQMLTEAKLELTKIFAKTGQRLKLVVIQVGDDKASNTYIRNKITIGESCGINVEHIKLPSDINVGDLRKVIKSANDDYKVTSVLLQLPLPTHLKRYTQSLIDMIDCTKDCDGITTCNIGKLWSNKDAICPATAQGLLRLSNNIANSDVVLIGRSNLCNIPLIKILEQKDCTVTLCHSKTKDLKKYTKNADIVISAVGKPKIFDKSYFKDDATIIDVGISYDDNGKISGDIDIESLKDTNISVTPTPKGSGLTTLGQLILNTIKCYKLQNGDI